MSTPLNLLIRSTTTITNFDYGLNLNFIKISSMLSLDTILVTQTIISSFWSFLTSGGWVGVK